MGGEVTDVLMQRLRRGARVVVCGESSQYDRIGQEFNPRILGPLMDVRATMSGFLVREFAHRFDEVRARLSHLYRAGRLAVEVDTVDGLDHAPAAFIGMLAGESLDKRLVRP